MYLAHQCPQCKKADIVYYMDGKQFNCQKCSHVEDKQTFWQHIKNDSYIREIESELETNYPYKSLDIINSTLNLIVGYHLVGKSESVEQCLNRIKEDIVLLKEKHGICYCNLQQLEESIQDYENIPQDKRSKKYTETYKTLRATFQDVPKVLKQLMN